MRSWLSLATLSVALTCVSRAAEAHLVDTRLGDFYGGMVHPLTGFEYMLPWLALAVLAALQVKGRGRWLFLVFPLGLFAGSVLSVLAPKLGFVPLLDMVLIAGVGALVALAAALPLPLFIALAAVMGATQGYENSQAMTLETDQVLFIGGVMAIGYIFAALLSSITMAFLDGGGAWRRIALRAGGSWIAAVGIMVLALQFVKTDGAGSAATNPSSESASYSLNREDPGAQPRTEPHRPPAQL